MADQNIDSLQLEITSSSSEAEKSLDRLTASLMGLNRSLLKIGNNAGALRSLASSLGSLERLKLPDFTNTINQLEKLSKIDLSNLNGKKVSIDFNISGMTEAERRTEAIQRAIRNLVPEAKNTAKELSSAFGLDRDSAKQMQSYVLDLYKQVRSGEGSGQRSTDALTHMRDLIIENGKIARNEVDTAFNDMSAKANEFMKEFGGKKFLLPDEHELSEAVGLMAGNAGKRLGENLVYVTKDATKGMRIDDRMWGEFIDNYGNGQLFSSGELENIHKAGEMIDIIVSKLKELKAQQSIPMSDALANNLTGQNSAYILSEKLNETYKSALQNVGKEAVAEKDKLAMQIPFDIGIDEEKFLSKIRNAITKAREEAKINVQLGVDTKFLSDEVRKAFSGIDTKNIGSLSSELTAITDALYGFTKVDTKNMNMAPLVNSLARLSKESKGIDPKVFNELSNLFSADFIGKIAAMGETNFQSTGLNSFVNALVRLSKESKNFDPAVFNSLSQSVQQFTQIAIDVEPFAVFVKSLNSFVRNAEKMRETANIFPALAIELNEFFEAMANVDISENTVRMAEALAKVAENGKDAGSALGAMTKAMDTTSGGIDRLKMGMDALMKVTDKLLGILKKIGGSALTGIKNLVSQFTQLGKASGNINTLTGNVKTLLATMIGFRGITGLFNWTKEAVTAGADLTEIDHIVESVFGENMVGYVQNWANSALESFGIASTAAKKYAGTLTAMFQSSDVGIQESNKMAMDLVGLAGDLSAFYNIDTETAYNKIKSGMAGMVRPLRDLGIDLTAATLKEYALSQGIEKSYSSMTQAEKMMLRYKYLMQQTTTQSGDFERTSGKLKTAA